MLDLQKFYADTQRCLKHERAKSPSYDGIKAAQAAVALFVSYCRGQEPLANALGDYWCKKYIESSAELCNEPTRDHIDWLADALSLLDGSLEADRDFSREDWEEIRLLVDSDAQDLPLETVSAIMTIMVERGVL